MPRRYRSQPTYYEQDLYSERPQRLNLGQMLLEQGDLEAERAQRTWGGIGQAVAGLSQQYGQLREEQQAKQVEERKQGELRARDTAIAEAFQSWDGKDASQLHRTLIRHTDPKSALDLAKGAESLQRLTVAKSPDEAAKELLPVARGFKVASPEMRARLYPSAIRPALSKSGLVPEDQLPPEYGPEVDQFVDYVLGMQPQEKPQVPLRVSPGETLLDPATREPIYTAPKPVAPPEAPKVQSVGGRVKQFNPATGRYDIDLGESEAELGRRAAAGKGRELKPILSGDIEDLATMQESLDLSKELLTAAKTGKLGAGSRLGTLAPDVVTEFTGIGAGAKGTQGLIKLAKQIIGKGLEGGVLRKEDERKYEDILPKIGDAPDVAQAKVNSLLTKIERKYNRRLEALEDAGRDVTQYRTRQAGPSVSADGANEDALLKKYGY